MTLIIDGKKIAESFETELYHKIGSFHRPPGLAFIIVGNNPASYTYVKMKKKKCLDLGIVSKDRAFPDSVTEQELIAYIHELNRDPAIDGILIQQPLPETICNTKIMGAIDPNKDVDGFHPINVGKLLLGDDHGFIPCTPLGIWQMLRISKIAIEGQHIVVIGRSNIVGKPLAALLMQKKSDCNATVTIAHSHTKNLPAITQSADILIAAMGNSRFVTPKMIRPGVVVIDVGINRVDRKIVGDVDYEAVAPLCKAITPVPGGVGPMTIAMLMANTVLSYTRRL